MIKIAFVIDTIESPTAGTEKQLLMLIKYLDRSKFQPFLCVLRTSQWLEKEFVDCELINIDFSSFGRILNYLNLLKFSRWMRKQHINIVQTHFTDGNKVGSLAGKLAGVRSIISTRRNQGYWHSKHELILLSILNKWATRFLANSKDTKRWAINIEGIDPQRIEVIRNGLEIDRFYKGSEDQRLAFRKQLVFPSDAVIIGIVANLRPVKAIDVFIRAAKIVLEKTPHAFFVIIGDGPERLALQTLCNDLGLESSVRFLGRQLDIPDILSCIDIGVLSSNSESFSNAIIEYMAAELAVVCTDVGGVREAIEEDINGYIVKPSDYNGMAACIIKIIENNLLAEMGREGSHKAKLLFSSKIVLTCYQQFYEDLV